MLDLDLTEQIRSLRSTFADIRAVIDVAQLKAEISRLNELAEAQDLWDDPENAQKVT
ncbi:MAG: peptide chain release factor 2, partial [Actinomycetales bacterium]|nr:peptide chain release factor 2 [Actinomycetales bacterium]